MIFPLNIKYGELNWTEMRRISIYRSQIVKYPIRFCACCAFDIEQNVYGSSLSKGLGRGMNCDTDSVRQTKIAD